MNFIWDKVTEWLKEILVSGILENFRGLFGNLNQQISDISAQVGMTPQAWNGAIHDMIRNLSQTVMMPIAGVILAFIMTLELIQLVMEKNNMHEFDTWVFFRWIFKTFGAVLIVTNTWNIVMGIFDMAQSVVGSAAGVIISDTSFNLEDAIVNLEARLLEMEIGPLLGMWFQSMLLSFIMMALTICIFVVIFGRMIEVYLVTSVAPIPLATMTHREWGQMGQNYIRSLLALGFQAFLIIICVGIYAVLVQGITLEVDGDLNTAIWTCLGYTVLLCFTLFKTSSLSKSVFGAH